MRSSRHWGEIIESLPAPALAFLIGKGLVDEWPIEATRRARVVVRTFPDGHAARLALNGNPSAINEIFMTVEEMAAHHAALASVEENSC